MAKQKSRSARKLQRQKAQIAEEHGLPQADVAELPAKLRPRVLDASGVSSYAQGDSSGQGSGASPGGAPTIIKVGLGVVFALALVFALSQMRKG